MIFYKVVCGLCLILLLGSHTALADARSKGDNRPVPMLRFLRLGLGLSALSYLLRLMQPPQAGHVSMAGFLTLLMGTVFIWLGWVEHCKLRRHRLDRSRPDVPPNLD